MAQEQVVKEDEEILAVVVEEEVRE